MTVREKINLVVKDALSAPLKVAGFRRKDRAWNRPVGSLIHVIDLQTSRWNNPKQGSFTLNLGVFVPSVHVACHGTPVPSFIREFDCTVRERIGYLVADRPYAERTDIWWEVDSGTDANLLGREVLQAITTWGFPFMDRINSVEAVRDFLLEELRRKKGKDFITELYLAVVYSNLGNIEEAKRSLNELNQRYPKDPRVERALAFVQRKAATSRW